MLRTSPHGISNFLHTWFGNKLRLIENIKKWRCIVTQNQQSVSGGVKYTLRLEALCVLIAGCLFYGQSHYSWKLFFLLFLVPDISFLGYLVSAKIGAISYNLAHSYILPITLGIGFILLNDQDLLLYVVIWIAHIGFDRALGYGLKYQTGFSDTHLGKIGKLKA